MLLTFATHNKNKAFEVNNLLSPHYKILCLADIGCNEDIPETGSTLKENALIKARYVKSNYHTDCFADDSGLEIEALNNEPGVYSARYAGDQKNDEANIRKVLKNLEGRTNRKASFRTVIALIYNNEEYFFEGIINGTITTEKRGNKGFGYDPVFIPEGHNKTFAEMELEEKNQLSHRAIAIQKLATFLKANG